MHFLFKYIHNNNNNSDRDSARDSGPCRDPRRSGAERPGWAGNCAVTVPAVVDATMTVLAAAVTASHGPAAAVA